MSFAAVNGVRVTSGHMTIPAFGRWCADITLADPTALPAGPAALTLVIGDLVTIGTLVPKRQDTYGGSTSARIVAGANGWPNTLSSRMYDQPFGVQLSTVLTDAAIELGEKVAFPGGDLTLGPQWLRPVQVGSYLLNRLAPSWWIDNFGTTMVGPRVATLAPQQFQVTGYHPMQGRAVIAADAIAWIQPGAIVASPLFGRSIIISTVEHTLNESMVRSTIVG